MKRLFILAIIEAIYSRHPLFFLLACLLLMQVSTYAQLEKNTITFGAYFDGNITSPKGADNTFLNLDLDLQAGYFINEGLALGLKLPLSVNRGSIINSRNSFSQVGISPYIQFFPGTQTGPVKGYLWLESGFYFPRSSSTELENGVPVFRNNSSSDWVVAGGVGLNFFFNKNVAFSTSLMGQYVTQLSGDLYIPYPNLSLKFGILAFLRRNSKE